MEKKTLMVEGCNLRLEYRLTGAGSKETLLFLHGAGMSRQQFEAQHDFFSDAYQVLSLSLRGHGQSDPAPRRSHREYTLSQNADDILAALDRLRIDKVHVIGNSAGGILGFYLIERQPQRVQSLVTFGTTAKLNYPAAVSALIAGLDRILLSAVAGPYGRFLSRQMSQDEKARQLMIESMRSARPAIPCLRRNLGHYDCLATIAALKVPYFLIQGELDTEINRSLDETLAAIERQPLARVAELPQAGHLANLDRPREFNELLFGFLSQEA